MCSMHYCSTTAEISFLRQLAFLKKKMFSSRLQDILQYIPNSVLFPNETYMLLLKLIAPF